MNATTIVVHYFWATVMAWWWLLPIFIALTLFKSRLLKEWLGKKIVTSRLQLHLDAREYFAVHNLIVPAAKGSTQIDHVAQLKRQYLSR